MNIKVIILLLVLSLGLSAKSLKQTVKETMTSYSEIVVNNLKVKSKKKNIKKEESAYYPTLDLESYWEVTRKSIKMDYQHSYPSWDRNDGDRTTLTATQLLWDWKKTPYKIDESQYAYTSTYFQTNTKNEKLIFDITKSYIDLVKQYELNQVLQYSEEAHQKALQIAQEKEEISGEALETYKTLGMVSAQEDKRLTQEKDTRKIIAAFKKYTGHDVYDVCRPIIDKDLIPKTLDEAISIALVNSPKIKEQEEIIKKQEALIAQSDSAYLPSLKLKLDAIYDHDLETQKAKTREVDGRVTLNWNFYSGGKDLTIEEQREVDLLKEKKTLEKIKGEVIESVTNLYTKYFKTEARISNFQDAIDSKVSILKITNEQLQDGTKTFLDVLMAQKAVIDAQDNKIKQEFELYNAYYDLLREFYILTDTILAQPDRVCKPRKVKNLIKFEEEKEGDLDNLLEDDSNMLDDNDTDDNISDDNISDENLTDNNETNNSFVAPELTLEEKVAKAFEGTDLQYDKDSMTLVLPVRYTSFDKYKVVDSSKDKLRDQLNSFAPELLQILQDNRDQIKAIDLRTYDSSEYRGSKNAVDAFRLNTILSKSRARKLKAYFLETAKENGLDMKFFKSKLQAEGMSSTKLIKDKDGIEDRVASRRMVLKIIKK